MSGECALEKNTKIWISKKWKNRNRHHHWKHEITIVPRFFFQQQQRETNLYFLLNNKQQQWPSMSNITSLPWTKEDTERREEKEKERHKNARTQNWHQKNNRSAPARKITMNKNENRQAEAFLQKHSKSCFYKPFLNQNLRQQHKAIQPKASNHLRKSRPKSFKT